jgi:hypothetical protein
MMTDDAKKRLFDHVRDIKIYDKGQSRFGEGIRRSVLEGGSSDRKRILSEAQQKASDILKAPNPIIQLEKMLTGSSSGPEIEGVIQSLVAEPGGKAKVEQAIHGLLASSGRSEKDDLSVIPQKKMDNAAEAMKKTGMFLDQDIDNLRSLVHDFNEIVKSPSISHEDINAAVNEAMGDKWKYYALSGVVAASGLHYFSGLPGGVTASAIEVLGIAGAAGKYQQAKNELISGVRKMVENSADPEVMKAMFAPKTPESVLKLRLLLAGKAATSGAVGSIPARIADNPRDEK